MAFPVSKQIIGMPVMGVAEGTQLGQVTEVLVDAPATRVFGFIVQPNGERSEPMLLRAEDVRAVGTDALTVDDQQRLGRLSEQDDAQALLKQQMPLRGKLVLTSDGQRVGEVDDFTIDPSSLRPVEYRVSPGGLSGLLGFDERRVPADRVVSSGPDALVVLPPEEGTNAA